MKLPKPTIKSQPGKTYRGAYYAFKRAETALLNAREELRTVLLEVGQSEVSDFHSSTFVPRTDMKNRVFKARLDGATDMASHLFSALSSRCKK